MGSKLERPHEFLQSYQFGHLVYRVLFSSSSWEEAQHHHSWASVNQLLLLNGVLLCMRLSILIIYV